MFPPDFAIPSGIADMPIPGVDQQGDLVIAALVGAVAFALFLRFRVWRRAH